ncbi:dihydroorotase, multifunctional complex type [Methanoregula boonei 6A8]|uniref:Dihydroorotase, multifunctional complex type n=1 Tax=Methanoregula boonei (strain DSM 21154 / JCM 14090 / 6A8) TaxID=456442 RepID=A7I6K5_METB6|nr:amidohydrolase family protein [Methanoregula boonei]ABS55366.1 dihydroorotase, multifunctional complex type [Methanoregula boonei 6A8]
MESAPGLVLVNVQLPDGRRTDITIRNGRVVHAGAGVAAGDKKIDCTSLFVLPAAVDIHVHMRGGSQSAKEDWETGSRSALAGGVTVVVDQPNTIPPLTSPELFLNRVRDAQAHSSCSFAVNSGITPGTPIEAMWMAGAMAFGEIFFAPSSYGEAVDKAVFSRALNRIQALGGLATVHAEGITPGEDTGLAAHDALRSGVQEKEAVIAVRECNTCGCRLHFCHMSTAGSIDAAQGSVEVTPHHLFLSREMTGDADCRFKVNPPVRTERERKSLWERWDRIDVIASDHAPHTAAEKALPFPDAPSGVPGVGTLVPLLMAKVLDKQISLADVIRKTSTAPAALIGIPPAGFSPGDRADFALYPRSSSTVEPEFLHSRCGWTPFEGLPAIFPRTVILGGEIAFCDGEFFDTHPAWYPGKGYLPSP